MIPRSRLAPKHQGLRVCAISGCASACAVLELERRRNDEAMRLARRKATPSPPSREKDPGPRRICKERKAPCSPAQTSTREDYAARPDDSSSPPRTRGTAASRPAQTPPATADAARSGARLHIVADTNWLRELPQTQP
eukprot:14555124-Alexandrium_andersonii.AAC.1